MSGLMTYLVLHQASLASLTILEAGNGLGGRVHTRYFPEPFAFGYQELGAMRIPVDFTDPVANQKLDLLDSQLVLSLIDEMNQLNENERTLQINTEPWIKHSENGLQYFRGLRTSTGLPPTLHEIEENPTLSPGSAIEDQDTKPLREKLLQRPEMEEVQYQAAGNVYKDTASG
ncbi:L-amino-acid oxidase [Moelleriella libera RCEF 2490]|uniref:L-amino-acid oxidase n=1 Tax=Moelleriella libera RCEF 2490 TaxID=1081109 RepID=A0A168ETZ2_9HYPO|nr:L-amino-acid oxidase [Moelleriella libera RCEF 2490]